MIGARTSTTAQEIECVAALEDKQGNSRVLRGRKKAPMAFLVVAYILNPTSGCEPVRFIEGSSGQQPMPHALGSPSSAHGATMRTAKETARGLLLPISVASENL